VERYELPPERLASWLDRWAGAHDPVARTSTTADAVTFEAADGAAVECRPVIAGLPERDAPGFHAGPLLEHVARPRVVGVLLVRLGAHAVGVFEGERLVASKVDRRLVHGRNRAGGQSQRRFERRREGQARQSLQAAAALAARILLPHAERLDAMVGGGDRAAVTEVLADPRLRPLAALAVPAVVDVPEPRLEVLRSMPGRFRATVVIARKPG
jgi:Actinobacteria/chloroflexi VLRF1 release factor